MRKDGDYVHKGLKFGKVSGNAHKIVVSERVVLNFMQRMSGIATLTKVLLFFIVIGVVTYTFILTYISEMRMFIALPNGLWYPLGSLATYTAVSFSVLVVVNHLDSLCS